MENKKTAERSTSLNNLIIKLLKVMRTSLTLRSREICSPIHQPLKKENRAVNLFKFYVMVAGKIS